MIKINLLPVKAAKKKEKILNQIVVGLLVVILALAGLGWRYYSQLDRIDKVEGRIRDTEQKIAKLKEAQKKYDELQKKSKILDQQLAAITQLDKGRDWFIRVLDKISESVPRNQVWLESVTFGGGRQGGANNIGIKGKAYDRDGVAHFMGNLSIISCDDELPEEEKHSVCQLRNKRCRSWNEEEKNWKWDFEECRKFYRSTCDVAKSCEADVKNCQVTERNTCQKDPKAKNCQNAKRRCEEMKEECGEAKSNCAKLMEKQYIRYDSVDLSEIRLKKEEKGTGVNIYDFDLSVEMTPPPSE